MSDGQHIAPVRHSLSLLAQLMFDGRHIENAGACKAQSFVDGTLMSGGRHILMQVPVRHSLSLMAQ